MLDAVIQVANRRVALGLWHDLVIGNCMFGTAGRVWGRFSGIRRSWPLKKHKVLERFLGEGRKRQMDMGRVVLAALREVRPVEVRCGPEGGEQVVHEREMPHLLHGN